MNPSKNILEKFEENVPLVKEIFSATKDLKRGIEQNKNAAEQKKEVQQTSIEQAKETITKTRQSLESLQARIATGYNADDVERKVGALLASMEQIDLADKVAVKHVLDGMHDKTIDAKQSLEQTIGLLHDIEEKTEHLTEADAEKINDTKTGIASTQSQLDLLEHAVTVDDAVHKTEEKAFAAVQDELKAKWRCPNWLADKIHEYLTVKYIQKKEVEGFRGKAGGIMTGLLAFALGAKWKTFFIALESGNSDALKSAMNAFDFVKEKFAGVKDAADAVKEGLQNGDLKEKVNEVSQEVATETKEVLVEKKNAFKSYLRTFVKTNFHKDIDELKLVQIVDKIDAGGVISANSSDIQAIFEYYKNNKKERIDANWVDATGNLLSIPFALTRKTFQVLVEEGICSKADIAYQVVGGHLEYGLKGFKLFGTGMEVVMGKISLSEVGPHIAAMYDTMPDAAQELLFAYMYRTANSPLFKGMANLAAFTTKSLLYMAVDAKDDINSIKNVREALRGQATSAIAEMKEFNASLKGKGMPKLQGMQDRIIKCEAAYNSILIDFENAHDLMDELRKGSVHGRDKAKFIKDMKATGLLHNTGLIAALESGAVATTTDFRVAIAEHMQGVLTTNVGKLKNMDMFEKGRESWMRLMGGEKAALSLRHGGIAEQEKVIQSRIKANSQKGRFAGMKGKLYEAQLGLLTGYTTKESLQRTQFYFKDVKSFEDFMEKVKIVGKESPSALKFLAGKAPIFLIAGLEIHKDVSTLEKFKGLAALLPIRGPIQIMRDGAVAGKEDVSKLGLGAALLTYDGVHVGRMMRKGNVSGAAKYIGQPIVDVIESCAFVRDGVLKGGKIIQGFGAAARAEGGIANMGKSAREFLRTEGRLGRLGLAAIAVGAVGYGIHSLTSNDGLDKETQAMVDKYKDKPEELDKDIAKQRPTLPQDDRNDYLRAAVFRLGGFSPEQMGSIDVTYDAAKKEYGCVLPTVVNKDAVDALKQRLQTAVTQLDGTATVRTYFHERALVEFRELLTQQYKDQSAPEQTTSKQTYVAAMGYDATQAKNIIG